MKRAFTFDKPALLLSLRIQILGALLLFYLPIAGNAQVPPAPTAISPTPAGAGGLRTVVTPSSTTTAICSANCVITGGTRPGVGGNLFHSFGQFNIGPADIATFQNGISFDGSGNALAAGLPTSNILARVTGTNGNNPTLSSIYGTLQMSGFGNANLFMMNPAGFLFGPGATVNVGGMVAFTSADYLRLTDGKLFNAAPNLTADSILSTAPVASYGFLGSNPGAITVQGGQLSVTPGISLVGGNITIQSGALDNGTVQPALLSAPGSQINLASVASPGEILTGSLAQAPNINGQSFGTLGSVNISEQSVMDVSGNGGGSVSIRGSQFVLDNSRISANVTGPGPVSNGVESIGGGIDIQVSGNTVIQNLGLLETNVTGSATAGITYGGVHVKANRIEILGTTTFEEAFFEGVDPFASFTGIRSNVRPGSTGGNSGPIQLEANSLLINQFAQIETLTEATGNAGSITINTDQNLDIDFSAVSSGALFATGDAGNIALNSDQGNISLTTFPFLNSQTVESPGTAGMLSLNAPNGNIFSEGTTINMLIQPPLDSSGIRAVRAGGSGGILINANNLDLVGSEIQITNVSNLPAGDLTINLTGLLSLRGSSFVPLSGIRALAQGAASSAGMNISAQQIVITDGSLLSTSTLTEGAAGPLKISTTHLELTNGGQISSASRQGLDPSTGLPGGPPPTGDAGTITIQGLTGAAQSVLIDGVDSAILTNTVGTGHGGSINIFSQSLQIQNGGTLSAATSGTAPTATGGTISVNANTVNLASGGTMTASSSGPSASGEVVVQGLVSPAQSILIDGSASGIFTDTRDTGSGGDIHLSANSVTLQNGGALSAATTGLAPSATGGMITVNAEHVAVNSQAVITAETNGIAPAGIIDINTGTLTINSGGQIRSSSGAETEQVSAFALSSTGAPPLTGGTITVQGQSGNGSQADSVAIDGAGSGVFTESTGSRTGGDINLLTSQSVTMTNGASISASSTGTGNAGNININAGNQLNMTNSTVTTEATKASGGAIKITTTPSGTVELTNSTISASVLDGTGGGGNVDIDPQFVILQNSQILANAVSGPGGNINITTNLLLPDPASRIEASSQFGQQGNIVIQSPVSPASGKLVPLGQRPLLATALVSQRCAALAGGNASSFTVAGRDSLPAEPGGWVPNPLALSMAESNEGPATETGLSSFSEMEKGTPLLSLRKVAPAGFLTQSFGGAPSDCVS
jgi:filamentous hemagglutinin family protein